MPQKSFPRLAQLCLHCLHYHCRRHLHYPLSRLHRQSKAASEMMQTKTNKRRDKLLININKYYLYYQIYIFKHLLKCIVKCGVTENTKDHYPHLILNCIYILDITLRRVKPKDKCIQKKYAKIAPKIESGP